MAWSPQARAAAAAARKAKGSKKSALPKPLKGGRARIKGGVPHNQYNQPISSKQYLALHTMDTRDANHSLFLAQHNKAAQQAQKPAVMKPVGLTKMPQHQSAVTPPKRASQAKRAADLRGAHMGIPTPGYTRKRGRGAL